MIGDLAIARARGILRQLETAQADLRAGRPQLAKMHLERAITDFRAGLADAERMISRRT